HQLISLVVVAKRSCAHVFADQDVVEVAREVVDEVEAELIAGEAQQRLDGGKLPPRQRPAEFGIGREIPDNEKQRAGTKGALGCQGMQRVNKLGEADGGYSAKQLPSQPAIGDSVKSLLSKQQSMGHDAGGKEKQADGDIGYDFIDAGQLVER